MSWIAENIVTVVIVAALVLACALIVRGMVRRRKSGKCACGCDCGSCAGCSSDHCR